MTEWLSSIRPFFQHYTASGIGQSVSCRDSRTHLALSLEEKLEFQEYVRQWARELYRVVKPGGFLLNVEFAQTFHRMVCGLEDAGWGTKNTLM